MRANETRSTPEERFRVVMARVLLAAYCPVNTQFDIFVEI